MTDSGRGTGSIFGAGKTAGEKPAEPNLADQARPAPGTAAEKALDRAADRVAGQDAERKPDVTGASQEIKDSDQTLAQSADGDEAGKVAAETVAESLPGVRSQFGKHGSQDENDPLTLDSQVESLQQGAEAQSAPARDAPSDGAIAAALGLAGVEPIDGEVQFSSHPIAKFRIGRFQFDRGILRLSGDDLADFRKLMEKASPRDQALVTEINPEAANTVAKSFLESRRTRGVDTSEDRPGAA